MKIFLIGLVIGLILGIVGTCLVYKAVVAFKNKVTTKVNKVVTDIKS
jgi:hypothetical protein